MEICYFFRNDTHGVGHANHHRPQIPASQPTASELALWGVALPSCPQLLWLEAAVTDETPATSHKWLQSFPLRSLPSREQVPPEEAAEMSLPAACVLKESVSLGCVI